MTDQLVRAEYDETTGVSIVTLNTKYGVFTEKTKVHPEDADIANRWDGIRFAWYKCLIDRTRAKAKMYETRADGIRYALGVMRGEVKNGTCLEFGDAFLEMECILEAVENDALRCRQIANEKEREYGKMVEGVLTTRRNLRKYKEKTEE